MGQRIRAAARGRAIVLVDPTPAVRDAPAVRALLAVLPEAIEVAVPPGEAGSEALRQAVAEVQSAAVAAGELPQVFAIGGGSVLDAGKLVMLAAHEPGLLDMLSASPGGLQIVPGPTTASARSSASPPRSGRPPRSVPSPLHRGRVSTMVVGPALRPQQAVIDPQLTASLSASALAAGLVEPLARAVVPAICDRPLHLQDAQARALADTLLELGGQLATGGADAQWRLTAALTSTATPRRFWPWADRP